MWWPWRARPDKEHLRLGRRAEALAREHLVREHGFRVLERNWRSGRAEVDLIALDRDTVVFVEVRLRQHDALVPGAWTLSAHKRRLLRGAAAAYLRQQRRKPAGHSRWDIVEVRWRPPEPPQVLHYPNWRM